MSSILDRFVKEAFLNAIVFCRYGFLQQKMHPLSQALYGKIFFRLRKPSSCIQQTSQSLWTSLQDLDPLL
jgi:hypothetical protein